MKKEGTLFIILLYLIIIILFPNKQLKAISLPQILITKILIYGEDANDEFIEIYNTTNQTISLKNWSLKKQTKSGNKYNIISKFPLIKILPKEYIKIIPKDKIPLSNKEINYTTQNHLANDNTLILYDDHNNIIDLVGWGNTNNFYLSPVPNPPKGYLIQRKKINNTYQNTQNNKNDFLSQKYTNTQTTKNQETSSTSNTNQSNNTPPPDYQLIGKITFNEISIFPETWIEIFSLTNYTIYLKGWFITNKQGEKFFLKDHITPLKTQTLDIANGKINFLGDYLTLRSPAGTIIDEVAWGKEAYNLKWHNNQTIILENESLIKIRDGQDTNKEYDWTITSTPTYNESNKFSPVHRQNNNKMIYKYIPKTQKQNTQYQSSQNTNPLIDNKQDEFKTSLSSKDIIKQNQNIKTLNNDDKTNLKTNNKLIFEENKIENTNQEKKKIIIYAIYPNPNPKETEWIKLYNPNKKEIDLYGYKIQDRSNNIIKITQKIPPYSYIKIISTKNILNNNQETIFLLNSQNNIIDFFSYTNSKRGEIIIKKEEQNKTTIKTNKLFNNNDNTQSNINNQIKENKTKYIKEPKKQKINKIQITGIVIITPGNFSKRYLYLDNGWQIYMHSAKFPNLQIGDKIKAIGILSPTISQRIKIKTTNDIKILDHDIKFNVLKIKEKDINNNLINKIIKFQTQIIKSSNNKIYTKEKKLYLAIPKKIQYQTNKNLILTGILKKDNTNNFKIIVSNITPIDQPQTYAKENITPTQNLPPSTKKYLPIIQTSLIIILISLLIFKNKNML